MQPRRLPLRVGMCAVAPYFDLVHGRPVPIAHAFLYGIVKNFLGDAFKNYKVSEPQPPYVVPYAKREQIAALYATATRLGGMDAPYAFIYKNKDKHWVSGLGQARMADLEQFMCIHGPTVLAEAWPNHPAYYTIFMAYHHFCVGVFDRDMDDAGKPCTLQEGVERCAVCGLRQQCLRPACDSHTPVALPNTVAAEQAPPVQCC